MNHTAFQACMLLIAAGFTLFFLMMVVPPLIDNPDIVGAFAAGFVNPYASGYSTDVIMCWLVLAALIWYDSSSLAVPHRFLCLILGVVPGVAVGLSLYLFFRSRHLATSH